MLRFYSQVMSRVPSMTNGRSVLIERPTEHAGGPGRFPECYRVYINNHDHITCIIHTLLYYALGTEFVFRRISSERPSSNSFKVTQGLASCAAGFACSYALSHGRVGSSLGWRQTTRGLDLVRDRALCSLGIGAGCCYQTIR